MATNWILKLTLIAFIVELICAQLSPSDSLQIISLIKTGRNEKTGLYGTNFESTYKSIFVLQALGDDVREISPICKEIGYESSRTSTLYAVLLDGLLKCKNDFAKINETPNSINSLQPFYESLLLHERSNTKYDHLMAFLQLQLFVNQDSKLFNPTASSPTDDSSLFHTTIGLKSLAILYPHLEQKYQKEAVEIIENAYKVIDNKFFHELNDEVGFYVDTSVNSILTNSEFLEAYTMIGKFVPVEDVEQKLYKLLNYLLAFKYNVVDIDNSYYYVKALNFLQHIPIFSLPKNTLESLEEKEIILKTINVFGKDTSQNLTLNYKVLNTDQSTVFEGTMDVKDTNTFPINITNQFSRPGKYFLSIIAGEIKTIRVKNETPKKEETPQLDNTGNNTTNNTTNSTTNATDNTTSTQQPEEDTYTETTIFVTKFANTIRFQVNSKIKVSYLMCSVTNSGTKEAGGEVKIDYPKRSFKELKGTQNSILKVKLKINFGEFEKFKIEQMFLRLRHIELGKVYSVYSVPGKENDEHFNLNFDMSDPNLIEPYDGKFELSIIISDPILDNPIFWNFGKIDLKFQKPKDPTDITHSYKNHQKQKMEPNYTEEVKDPKIFQSLTFCGLIGLITLLYIRLQSSNKINLANFPRKDNLWAFLSALLFVVSILLITYIYLLFWLSINIIQALIGVGVVGTFAIVFGYRTLIHVKIDI